MRFALTKFNIIMCMSQKQSYYTARNSIDTSMA